MKFIKLFIIIVVVFALSSCSAQDNGGKTKEADSANTEKVPVSQIWNGYEELQGKQYGNAFTLPEKIEPVNVERLYSFVPKERPDWNKVSAGAEAFFKAFYGNSYDPGNSFESTSSGGLKQIQYLSYEDAANVSSSGIVYAFRKGYKIAEISSQPDILVCYDPDSDRNIKLELDEGECTVGELCDYLTAFSKTAFYPMYDGYELEPVKVTYQCTADMKKTASVLFGIKRDGIFMETYQSSLFEQEHRQNYDVLTYYSFNQMTFEMSGVNDILGFTNVTLLSKMQEEPLDEIISLKEAVRILETSLADQSKYRFQSVNLMYCQKFTYPVITGNDSLNSEILADYGEIPDQPFVPTWCFTWNTEQDGNTYIHHIKVNAVSGEITADV